MHTSLHEAETDDRRNKNDINPNTHSSMNPLMQYAKTHTVLVPNPHKNTTQPHLYAIKAKKKEQPPK